jgi:RimJ/RimL family protein N-acetyltransferase
MLLSYLANQAMEQGCPRFEWIVLDWNKPSIDFYKAMGAYPLDEWTVYRLENEALSALAQKYKNEYD